MSKNQIIGKINLHSLLIVLIIFCVFEYGIQKIWGFTLYPDEFGYWASAASVVGYDWSEVASLGSYYSFGYSLILIPILKIFSGGVMAYRAAVFINMLLMCVGVFLFGKLIEGIFPETRADIRVLVSGVSVLYPAWIFYMQMTLAEAVLIFVFTLTVYLFYRFMEKQKISTAVALAASLIYGYCVHMRTVGVVIACVLVCIFRLIREKGNKNKKVLLIWFGAVAVLCGLAFFLKGHTISRVFSFAEEGELAVNDYSSQWSKIAGLFTREGIQRFMWSILGKLYYLGMSSFGTFYWAVGWCLKESISLFKTTKRKIRPRQWLALFVLLAIMGQVLISSIYMNDTDVIDGLVYGRYNELFVPVTMMIGIIVMSRSRFLVPLTILIGTILRGITFLLLRVIEQNNMSNIRGYHVAGISYLLQGRGSDFQSYFWHTWMLGFGMILLVCAFVWLGRWRSSTWWMYAGILIIEIAAGLQISNHYTYEVNYINFENQIIAELLQEKSREEINIMYLEEDFAPFVDLLQMQIPEETIHVITIDELPSISDNNYVVVTYAQTGQDEVLKKMFDKKTATKLFCVYYNL